MTAILLFGLAWTVVPAWAGYQHTCRQTTDGAETGLVRLPDFGPPPHLNVSCVWSYSAQGDNRKVLIRVDSVHFPPDELRESSLRLVLDDEFVEIPRNCVRCLKQNFVSASHVKVIYKTLILEESLGGESPSEAATSDIGSFQIRYKSFDPNRCDAPKQPLNGFASVSSRRIGKEVVYGCKAPYDVSGPNKALCHVKDDLENPVPEWNAGPPKCVVTNCSATVYRTVGTGAVASPGYPMYLISSPVDCRWVLQADQGSQIEVTITFLQLSGRAGSFGTLSLYDQSGQELHSLSETSDKKLSIVTNTSELVVSLVTNNTQTVKGGFYIEYKLARANCSEPSKPDHGEVVYSSLAVGSSAAYRCLPGYVLTGEAHALCQIQGTWSGVLPRCVPHLDFQVHDNPGDSSSLPTSSSIGPTTSPEVNASVVTLSFEQPKVTKPSKKSRARPTEKTIEKTTARPKSTTTMKYLETNSSDAPNAETGEDVINELTPERKPALSVNAAKEKVKLKNKENSTTVKHTIEGEPVPGVVHKVGDSSGPRPIPHLDREDDTKMLDVLEEEAEEDEEALGLKSYIIIGVASALLLIVVGLVTALVIYRRRFPVRLGLGRRFSTFENPIYVSKDAQHTRELKRLTI